MDQDRQASYLGEEDMSRLEKFMARMEAGQPYGNQSDIDMLLDEVVKRLERRVIAKIDEIQIHVQQSVRNSPLTTRKSVAASESSPPSTPRKIRKISGSTKPSLEPNMDLLNHDVQDLVQEIVMTSAERVIETSIAANRNGQQNPATIFRPSRVITEAKKTHEAKPDKEMMTRYAKGTVKAMMFTATASDEEEDSQDNFRMMSRESSSKGRPEINSMSGRNVERSSTTRPISSGYEEKTTSSFKPNLTPLSEERRLNSDVNRKVLGRLGGKDQNINANYTYTLRSSMRRAIPKYLQQEGAQSKAAVMHMFNAIRFAMADDSIESIVAEALGETFSRKDDEREGGNQDIKRKLTQETSGPKASGTRGKQVDGGRKYFEARSWSKREPEASEGRQTGTGQFTTGRSAVVKEPRFVVQSVAMPADMDTYAQNERRVTFEAGKTDGTSAKRKVSWDSISQLVHKGSPQDAMLSMADTIRGEKFSDGWHQHDIDNFFEYYEQERAKPSILKKQKADFVGDTTSMPRALGLWKAAAKRVVGDTMRYDSNMNYHIRKTLRRAMPKFTCSKMVSGALLHLSDKLMDELPLQSESLPMSNANIEISDDVPRVSGGIHDNVSKKSTAEDLPWVSKGNDEKGRDNTASDLPWVTKGKNATCRDKTSEELPWVTKGQNAQTSHDNNKSPWITKGENATSKKVTNDSYGDLPWVSRGNAVNDQKRTAIPVDELPPRASVGTQTSMRALYDEYDFYPQTVTAGRGWNKNTNQSVDTVSLSSGDSFHEEIFYDALSSQADLQIKSDYPVNEMSFLKRFRLNLLFRKKKTNDKKFVSAVHKVIEARRSGCIDDDGNFVQGFPTPSPKTENNGKKSPPPPVKPKPKKSVDQNGNKQQKQRGSSKKRSNRRRHNPDRNSYPLPEEDDGSEGYASASEMDNYEFNPTAFLERNRRSAENRFFNNDDGTDADVESDSDGANASNRRVRFSDDVQHFGEIVALGGTESSDNLDAEDDEPDSSLMSLKSKIQLFEKVSSNEFLDDRSYQGSPPPDIPENASLPTKDRVQLFEDISTGKKPTTCAEANLNKIPRRAVASCQFTQTKSKISFFEQLSEKN